MKKIILLALVFGLIQGISEGQEIETKLNMPVLLANSIDLELAPFLEPMLEVVHSNAKDFDRYKKEKFIVILGGPDAYEGIGEIVNGILDPEEEKYIRTPGKKRMYIKTNVWEDAQVVCIIAGSGRDQTKEAMLENLVRLYQSYLSLYEDQDFRKDREHMVENHLKARGITDEKVIGVMGRLPRHKFVGKEYLHRAYADHPLPIGEGQTISQPYVVALMTQALGLKGHEKVLEIGTGSGYQAAILAELVEEVYTIEIREKLASSARKRLEKLGYTNVQVRHADGYFGWDEHAPYDAIMITAAVDHIPYPLIHQLKEGGRLILPLGPTTYYQTMTIIEKKGGEIYASHLPGFYSFVPMIGEALK
jgi:protein-L-isoaspartate(D-aspartate) O-methyltransferase